MRDLIKLVLSDFKENVTGFVTTGGVGPTHYLFAAAVSDDTTRDQLLATNINTFRTLIATNLKPRQESLNAAPDQYAVLSMAAPGRPIINYNVDRLASVHCPNANITAVHGEVPDFIERLPLKKAVQLNQEGLEIIPRTSFWLPEPEREPELLRVIDPAYRDLVGVSQIVIIGYSFGLGEDGISDAVSFNALVEYCRDREVRVVVVDPSPSGVVGWLSESLRNLDVVGVPVFWNLLCTAILSVIREHGLANLDGVGRLIEGVEQHYYRLIDQV
jgi:hypothetical protein